MSIDGTYDTDNIFAKILRGEMPCVKVFEDDHVLAFMDIFPQSDGHTLVLPKTSARNLLDLDDEALSATMIRVKRLAAAVKLALNPDGIVITQFNGAPAGQTVFHTHFHIIPRSENQSLGRHGGGQADMDVLQAQANKIRAALN